MERRTKAGGASPRWDPSATRREPPERPRRGRPALSADQHETLDLLVRVVGRAGTARALLAEHDLVDLSRLEAGELAAGFGLAAPAAARLAAAFALGRRTHALRRAPRPTVRTPARVQRLLEERVLGSQRETFFALLLDGKHALRRVEVVSVGTLTTSLVHPREVFRAAVRESAAAVVCAHNHPSGDPEPSREDLDVTRRLVDAGKLLGIPLLDHVVLGDGRFVSLRERLAF